MMPRRNVNRQDEQDVPDVQYMLDVQYMPVSPDDAEKQHHRRTFHLPKWQSPAKTAVAIM